MPPKSVGSAFALIGLCSLAAVEAGGCDKRPESLRSATRSALPLVSRAARPGGAQLNYALSDYGLQSRPDMRHVCGHYELRADGHLTTWDLFVTSAEANQLRHEVDVELGDKTKSPRSSARKQVSVTVDSSNHFQWPQSCPKTLMATARSVLVATRVL